MWNQRGVNLYAAARTEKLEAKKVASIEMDSPLTKFFWISRNKVTSVYRQKSCRGFKINDVTFNVELHVTQEELYGPLMQICLGVLTGEKKKIQINLDEFP